MTRRQCIPTCQTRSVCKPRPRLIFKARLVFKVRPLLAQLCQTPGLYSRPGLYLRPSFYSRKYGMLRLTGMTVFRVNNASKTFGDWAILDQMTPKPTLAALIMTFVHHVRPCKCIFCTFICTCTMHRRLPLLFAMTMPVVVYPVCSG